MFACISESRTRPIVLVLCLLYFVTVFAPMAWSQDQAVPDEKIIERYKQMLERKPKEGSTFDRLYHFYLEGDGLDQMVADYQAKAQAKPNDPNIQLILGHIYKRLGKDAETLSAYQRAVELAPHDYYPHAALGEAYAMRRQHEETITALTQAVELATKSQTATPDDLTVLYKTLGRTYFSQDRIDDAVSAWKKIAELDPENIFARIELADLFREQELYDQAIAQHQAIVALKTEDAYRVCMSHREIGKIQEEKGDYEAALTSYDAALALTAPGNWLRKDLQHRIVGIYAADGDWEGLIEYYNGKLQTTPNDPELIGLSASAHIENQQLDEGIAAYRKGLALAPTDTNLRLNLIAALRSAEKFEEAAAEYETLSEEHPDNFGIYRELGELYLQLNDEPRARATYQRMIDRDPNNAGTHLILAEIYAGHGWFDDAVTEYEKAISLAPMHLDYIEYFGEFYLRQGNRDQAVETWKRMIEGDLGTAANYHRLAKLFNAKEFHTEAVAASRQAVALEGDEYRYREALARLLMESKEYDEALAQYTQAAKLAPNEFFAEQMGDQQIEIYRRQGTLGDRLEALEAAPETFDQQKQLAKMYLKLGNVSYTVEVLTKAKALQPNDVRVNRWLADIHAQQELRDEAVIIYTHLIEIDPENAREYYANISRAHLNVMDFESATDAAKQAIAHSPRNPEGHQMLAEIAKQVGDYETAANSLKQAIRLRPEATDTRAELAAIYTLSDNFRQAIEQYWRCWELTDSVEDKLGFVKSLFDAYYDLERGDELEEQLKHKSKANPSNMGPVLALAEIYRMAGDLPRARFQLAQALDLERDNPDLLRQLAEISLDLGDIQDALSYQQQLVKAQPDSAHQQRLGELLFDAGREQEAIQAWTQLLHAKDQPFEAEVKLATLLIHHGLSEKALSVLDRAGEKVKDAKAVYQIGAMLVQMNEYDHAQPHFERILQMSKPPQKASSKAGLTYGQPGIRTPTFSLAEFIAQQIHSQQTWRPTSFEEAQTGALVQLKTIAEQQETLDKLIRQLETAADTNPKDIQSLEQLAQIYALIGDTSKGRTIIDRLIALSPNDPAYQSIRLDRLMAQNLDYETLKTALDKMTGLTSSKRYEYIAQYVGRFYHQGKKAEAIQLLDELEDVKVTDLNTGAPLVETLVSMGKLDVAERVITQLPTPTPTQAASPQTQRMGRWLPAQQQWYQYSRIYRTLADAYAREGQTDKWVALFWTFCELTKPNTSTRRVANLAYSTHTYNGYTPVQSSYPSPTVYYSQNRLQQLQEAFLQLWTKEQLGVLYTKLQNELDAAEGRERVYPGLALSYCYWWERKRDKAQQILAALQDEFPDDLTLKLHTVFISIQTGQHETALKLIDELIGVDPKNRHQYYDLILQLVTHTENTVKMRELMTKVLNSSGGAREFYQFSRKLQQGGVTQYAIAVAKKAVPLAMGQRDPNFLMELSQHLEQLGLELDADRLAERAMRFANQHNRYGQMLLPPQFYRRRNLTGRSEAVQAREPQLVEAAQKNPNSFLAHKRLATFHESINAVKKASAAYDAALAIRPKDSTTRQRYAQMLKRNGLRADATDQYTLLLKENPNALGRNYWQVIETFFEARKVDELVSLAKEMIGAPAKQTSSISFVEEVAEQCMRRNLPKAAIEIYEKIIESDSTWMNMYLALASAYDAAGQRDKAIQFLRENLETHAEHLSRNPHIQERFVSKLIKLYKESPGIESLVTEYEAKLAEKPEDQWLLYLGALIKIAANDLEGSDSLVNQLLDNKTRAINTDWLNKLADAYRGANDPKRELRLLETATERLNTRKSWQISSVYQKLGDAYARNGEKERAHATFRKMGAIRILQRGGDNFWKKAHVANIYMQYGMWDDAETMFTEVLNDPSFDQHSRERAQQHLMILKQRKSPREDGLITTTRQSKKTEDMNLGQQRALAQQHKRQREFSKAEKLYKQIIETMPEDLESRTQLALVYSQQRNHDAAIAEWQALLKVDSENTEYQDGLVNAYQAAGKIDTAIELAQQYIEADENGIHYARLARLYTARNRIDDAILSYKKAIELTSSSGRIYSELARLYLRKEDFEAAEKTFEQALQHAEEEWEQQNIEGEIRALYRRRGKLEEMLEKAEAEGTLTFEMQRSRAQNYLIQGEFEKATEAYKKAIDMAEQRWNKEYLSAELVAVYAKLGQTQAAIELYETVSQTGSQNSLSWMHHGSSVIIQFGGDNARRSLINALTSVGKLEDLLAYLVQDLESDADSQSNQASKHRSCTLTINPVPLEIIAEIYRIRGNDAKAAETYQRLCKAQPNNVRSFYYAAAAFNRNGQPELAQKLLDAGAVARAANRWNQDRWRLISLGQICIKGELYDTAIQLLELALSDPKDLYGDSSDQQMLNHTLAQAYFGAERYVEAVQAYRRLANVARDNNMRKIAKAGIRKAYSAGNLSEQLIEEGTQAVAKNPDDPDAHFALAQAYELKEMPDEAIAAYERARALNLDSPIILEPLAKLYAEADPDKAKPLYKELLKLEDNLYARIENRKALIELYKRQGEFDAAIAELLQTIHAAPEMRESNGALRLLWDIYETQRRAVEGVATLEELAAQITDNPTLYEVLGDAYKETGDLEKSNAAYAQWIERYQNEMAGRSEWWQSLPFISKLLAKQVVPEKTLEFVERVSQAIPDPYLTPILGEVYLINGRYQEAEAAFKRGLIISTYTSGIWGSLIRSATVVEDTERFPQLVEALVESTYDKAAGQVYANLTLATFHRTHNRPEEAEQYMRKSGVIPENAWWIIGMFDKTDHRASSKGYIPEEAIEIDPTVTYDGRTGPVTWKHTTDDTRDGAVDFAGIFGFGRIEQLMEAMSTRQINHELQSGLAYAWVSVNSPNEREVQIRIATLNTVKIWVNGKGRLSINQDDTPMPIGHHTASVTLNPGANSVLIKVSGNQWGWRFGVWFTHPDGKPLEDLTFPKSNK